MTMATMPKKSYHSPLPALLHCVMPRYAGRGKFMHSTNEPVVGPRKREPDRILRLAREPSIGPSLSGGKEDLIAAPGCHEDGGAKRSGHGLKAGQAAAVACPAKAPEFLHYFAMQKINVAAQKKRAIVKLCS